MKLRYIMLNLALTALITTPVYGEEIYNEELYDEEFINEESEYDEELYNEEFYGEKPEYDEEPEVFEPFRHTMEGIFFAYNEPDLRSPIISVFNPQSVIVVDTSNGFYLIYTYRGYAWIYPNNRLYITHKMHLFDAPDGHPEGIVAPQIVRMVEVQNEWVLIETWLGDRWINRFFVPPTHELTAMLNRFGRSVGVFYENHATGFVFTHNPDRVFFSASVPKVFFALYLFKEAGEGRINLDDTILYTRSTRGGAFSLIRRRYGTSFTQRELLRLNTSQSDCIATMLLANTHGFEGLRGFLSDMGVSVTFGSPRRITNTHITARQTGLVAREIYNFIESDAVYANEFKQDLLNNQHQHIRTNYPIASKSGWSGASAWHDMAIIYADSPFTLVILSNRSGAFSDFARITEAFENFNRTWF